MSEEFKTILRGVADLDKRVSSLEEGIDSLAASRIESKQPAALASTSGSLSQGTAPTPVTLPSYKRRRADAFQPFESKSTATCKCKCQCGQDPGKKKSRYPDQLQTMIKSNPLVQIYLEFVEKFMSDSPGPSESCGCYCEFQSKLGQVWNLDRFVNDDIACDPLTAANIDACWGTFVTGPIRGYMEQVLSLFHDNNTLFETLTMGEVIVTTGLHPYFVPLVQYHLNHTRGGRAAVSTALLNQEEQLAIAGLRKVRNLNKFVSPDGVITYRVVG